MHFLLENDRSQRYDFENLILKSVLDKNKLLHTYEDINIDNFYDISYVDTDYGTKKVKTLKEANRFPKEYKNAIPVGSINFVTAWLNIFYGIEKENPIEIPPILRTDEFLKRKYSIVTSDKIPREGNYFIKDVSMLKEFSYAGNVELLNIDELFKQKTNEIDNSLKLDPNHLFQVSEKVDILSEYRVYVIGGEIEAISNYNGSALILPDTALINKANLLYSTQKNYPKSYSMDVMVTDRGTSIIEIHNYTSLGHYNTLFGSNLAYAYRDGIDYLIGHNTPISEFSNF